MRKTLKIIAASLAAVTAMSCASAAAFADKLKTVDGITYRYSDSGEQTEKYTGWTRSSKGRRCYKNGVMYKNKWIKTKSGKYYYAGKDGYMRTGWAAVTRGQGIYSYFDKNGVWDGKTYFNGYQPDDLCSFFLDFDFFSDDRLSYGYTTSGIAVKDPVSFENISTLREILEGDLYTKTIKDKFPSDDERELSDEIYHGGKCIKIKSSDNSHAYLEFTKDAEGNSYLYNGFFGFGLKLKDSSAYDKLAALLKSENAPASDEQDETDV